MKKRLTVGIITAECYRDYTTDMICGILAQSERAGCNVIVLAARNNFQEPVSPHVAHEADLFRLIGLPEFDGFIYDQNAFALNGIRKKLDALLKRTGKPVMLLDAREHPFFDNTVSHTLAQIAELCGYTSYAHFAKQFKAYEGITLSMYRERSRKAGGM